MRVAIVVPGGVERRGEGRVIPFLLWLLERLAARHEVHVFALAQEPEKCDYVLLGAHVHCLGGTLDLGSTRPALWAKATALRKGIADHGPFEAVHAFWANTAGFLCSLVLSRDVPLVVSLAGGEFANLPRIGYGQETNIPGKLRVALALERATVITAASGQMEQLGAGRGYRVEIVPLGVGDDCFSSPRTFREQPPFRIITVASLNPVKDPFTLVSAFHQLLGMGIDATLTHVGEDTLGGAVQAFAESLGIADRVEFRGHLSHREVPAILGEADLFVLASQYEAGPLAVLEAAAAGVPVTGTNVGHVADWAPAMACAVPVADPEGLARGMREVLLDPERRRAMSARAFDWTRRHDANETARRFEEIYAGAWASLQNARAFRRQ